MLLSFPNSFMLADSSGKKFFPSRIDQNCPGKNQPCSEMAKSHKATQTTTHSGRDLFFKTHPYNRQQRWQTEDYSLLSFVDIAGKDVFNVALKLELKSGRIKCISGHEVSSQPTAELCALPDSGGFFQISPVGAAADIPICRSGQQQDTNMYTQTISDYINIASHKLTQSLFQHQHKQQLLSHKQVQIVKAYSPSPPE